MDSGKLNKQNSSSTPPTLASLLSKVFPNKTYTFIKELGGCTNKNYLVKLSDDKEIVVQIPGKGTNFLIVFEAKIKNSTVMSTSGIGAKILYSDKTTGVLVTEHLKTKQATTNKDLENPDFLKKITALIRKIHTSKPFANNVNPFERNKKIFKKLSSNEDSVNNDELFIAFYNTHNNIQKKIQQLSIPSVPCHNDITVGNILQAGDIHIIDWEYAGNNHRMFGLANLSVQSEFSDDQDELFLKTYFEVGEVSEILETNKHQFYLYKQVVEVWRALWAKLQLANNNKALPEAFYHKQYSYCLNNLKAISNHSGYKAASAWLDKQNPLLLSSSLFTAKKNIGEPINEYMPASTTPTRKN